MQDYSNQLAQMRAGKSNKSKLLLAKFKSADSLEGWEVRKGAYFQDVVAAKYDGGMDAKFEFTETGNAIFSGVLVNNLFPLFFVNTLLFIYMCVCVLVGTLPSISSILKNLINF